MNPSSNQKKKSNLWFNIGLFISLFLTVMAFEWRTYNEDVIVDDCRLLSQYNEPEPPITVINPPPKPKPKIPRIVEVEKPEDVEIEQTPIVIDFSEIDVSENIPEIDEPLKPEKPNDIITYAEEMPMPKGGYEAFYEYISKNVRYPSQAKRIGVEGRVSVEFVVDEKGKLKDIKVVRGIGAGCDEEVIRLLKNAPSWNPGRQRFKPVKVRVTVPIIFSLE